MRYVYLDKPAYDPDTEIISPDYKIKNGAFIAGWKVEPMPDEDGHIPVPEEQPVGAPTLRDRVGVLETATVERMDQIEAGLLELAALIAGGEV